MEITNWSSYIANSDNSVTIKVFGYIGIPDIWLLDEEREQDVIRLKEQMRNEIEKIKKIGAKKINLKIDSFGGSVNHALSMYNALASTGAEIEAEYVGWSASAATFLASVASKVKAPNNFQGLIHEGRGATFGVAGNFAAYADALKKTNEAIAHIYAVKGGKDVSVYASAMSENGGEGTWRTADEMKEIGLIDDVYEPVGSAFSYSEFNSKTKKFNLTNNINMGIFSKDKKTVNSIKLNDVTAVYEADELKTGLRLTGVGSEVIDGVYDVDGKSIEVENSVIKSITEKQEDTFTQAQVDEMVNNAVSGIQAEIDALKATNAELEERVENLSSLRSGHKPPKIGGVENKGKGPVDIHDIIEDAIEAEAKIVMDRIDKERRGL